MFSHVSAGELSSVNGKAQVHPVASNYTHVQYLWQVLFLLRGEFSMKRMGGMSR